MKIETEEIQKVLSHLVSKDSESVEILQEPIDIIANQEFVKYQKEHKEDLLNSTDNVLKLEDKLYQNETSNSKKKEIIAALSLEGSTKAYRIVEKFLLKQDGELKQWSQIAKQQLKIKVERSLMYKKKVYVSSGLGGKNNLIRLFGVAYLKYEKIENNQYKEFQKQIEKRFQKLNGILEKIDIQEKYFTFKILVPVNTNIDNLLQSMKENFEEYNNLIRDDILITNVKKLSKNEIESHLKTIELIDLKKEFMLS
ncbi:MAG: hypothetical protein N4A32_01800 [Marinifilaceae bacterium]|jgi:hypothetical protein|nr:hypothetical protein [Marinifilaceae bacterium]